MIEVPHAPDSTSPWNEDVRAICARSVALGRAECVCDYPYHALWGLLRASGATGSLRYEEEALVPLLASLIGDGTRVMVAGSADTGTPCVVGRATFPKMPEMIVVDRCPAPLAVIEEFARERSLPCRTLRSDLVELELDSVFDVVLVNYTLSYIAPESRPELFRRLARALVPGGTLICATIARTGAVAADTKTNEAWVEATRRKIEAARLAFGLPPSELDALLRLGAENRVLRRRMRPTVEEIENCIRGAGLVLQEEIRSARENRTRTDGTRAVEIEPSVVFAATRRS